MTPAIDVKQGVYDGWVGIGNWANHLITIPHVRERFRQGILLPVFTATSYWKRVVFS